MPPPILEVEHLVKNFNKFRAVDDISFTVPKGKVVGLLGPNGAGKTTTIHMLLGITQSNGGTIKYFGKNFLTHRGWCLQRLNFASGLSTLQWRISVWENLLVFACLYQIKNPKTKITELCDYFGIKNLLPSKFVNLSAGQKARVNLVKSLLNDPEMILMDEPTSSLDPDIADKTLSLIEKLKNSRKLSILYTSHNMDEVTRICDSVIFLDHGKIVAEDTPLGLTKQITTAYVRLTFEGDANRITEFLQGKVRQYSFPNPSTVLVEIEERMIPEIIFGISKTGVEVTDIEIKKPTLEDVFLQIARKTYVSSAH